ncbi:hypothetical protein COLO4_14537 [Corchorus olitorius]|uniref:Uncharacterized protein n=1 Tax=Corchorus olitorius TaxID=93759 RepID=A0A1R3JRY4_9ROSI|nr:hypothetical protein COLO4_14537 [Corchorus olitorius]
MAEIMIPKELIFEIIHYFPLKTLLRFRCLSKQLYNEIVKAILRPTKNTKTQHKLLYWDNNNTGLCVADFDDHEISTAIKLGNPLTPNDRFSKFCGSCNDLLLLSSTNQKHAKVLLWLLDPFTMEKKLVIPCPVDYYNRHHQVSNNNSSFGFGYDSINNRHKIVLIDWVDESSYIHWNQVWVFHFASITWTKLTVPHWQCHKTINQIGVFSDNALHWLSCSPIDEVVTFDLSNEMFVKLIPSVPWKGACFPPYSRSLHVLGGNLVMFQVFLHHFKLSLALKNEEEQYTWITLYNLNFELHPYGIETLLEVSKNGEKLLLVTCSGVFYWYDLEENTMVRIDSLRVPRAGASSCEKAAFVGKIVHHRQLTDQCDLMVLN